MPRLAHEATANERRLNAWQALHSRVWEIAQPPDAMIAGSHWQRRRRDITTWNSDRAIIERHVIVARGDV
jgi:hypothetical protein